MCAVKIGKKLILTLTSSMYEDSRFIFREYIQNSADQIDIAIRDNILRPEDATIIVEIDKSKRCVKFYDNATGIEADKVKDTLGNIADSEKSGIDTKGFIGIGRLGGLAYCDTLQFITSYKGENVKTIMKWDACKLQSMIEDPSVDDDAASIIEQSFDISQELAESDEHYFEVIMESVHESSDALLEVESIREYLSMVAPVPYENTFTFANKIKEHVEENGYPELTEYRIILNHEQLFKGYKQRLYKETQQGKTEYDKINDIAFKEFKNENGTVLGWMWYGLSCFETVIPKPGNYQRGLRLRCKNIQIGSETTIMSQNFFRESRGSNYFVGEIHVIHPKIIPNSRRDYFVEGKFLSAMERQLRLHCSNYLHDLYHNANQIKNTMKKEAELEQVGTMIAKKDEQGYISDKEKQQLLEKQNALSNEVVKKSSTSDKIKNKRSNDPVFEAVITNLESKYKAVADDDIDDTNDSGGKTKSSKKLSLDDLKLNKGQKAIVSKISEILKRVLPKERADELIDKIYEDLYI